MDLAVAAPNLGRVDDVAATGPARLTHLSLDVLGVREVQ
jgi:hypothetical protein